MQTGFENLTDGPQQPGASSASFLWSDSKQRVNTNSHLPPDSIHTVHFAYVP
jgi:hypothetical protein